MTPPAVPVILRGQRMQLGEVSSLALTGGGSFQEVRTQPYGSGVCRSMSSCK